MTVLILIIPLLVLGFISYNKSKTSLDDLGAINLANSAEKNDNTNDRPIK